MTWDGVERRKGNRMESNFEPQTPFEGYVKAMLENFKDRFNALPCPDELKRLSKCENEISNIKGKAAILGTLAGVVSAWFVKTFLER